MKKPVRRTNQLRVQIVCLAAASFILLSQTDVRAGVYTYWVFKSPFNNPIVPSSNFLGYWLPPVSEPNKPFPVGDSDYSFTIDENHPNGPFFATETDPETQKEKVIHNGIDLFAWLEKIDGKCYIRLFKTTDVVKPTVGGKIEALQKGDDGVANVGHVPQKPSGNYETYGHISPAAGIDIGTSVSTDTSLGTLSDLGGSAFVHLHYSVFVDYNAVDPLQYMEMKSTTCDNAVPAPGALALAAVGALAVNWLHRRRKL